MATAVADLSALLKNIPAGAWVAISEAEDRVIAYGADAQVVLNEAHGKGVAQPLILRIPDHASAMFL